MVVRSSNLSGAAVMTIEETCTYSQCPITPAHTKYRQEAKITAFLPFLSSRLEKHSFQSLSSKSAEGMQVVERLCQTIAKDGVLSLLDHADFSFAKTEKI